MLKLSSLQGRWKWKVVNLTKVQLVFYSKSFKLTLRKINIFQRHGDTPQGDTQQNDTQQNDTQQNDTQQNDTQQSNPESSTLKWNDTH
jgi:hypothetical protein